MRVRFGKALGERVARPEEVIGELGSGIQSGVKRVVTKAFEKKECPS